jgi:two-component system phosphate regulon sensor histidine kinase PhoR
LKKNEELVLWPHLYGKKFNALLDNIYDTYQYINLEKKRTEQNTNFLRSILEMLDEGVILLENNKIIHHNKWIINNLHLIINNSSSLLDTTNNSELIEIFTDIIENNNSFKKQYTVNNKIFQVYTIIENKYKLITFHDVTDMLMYENYKYELTGNITHELKTPVSLIMNYAETLINSESIDKETNLKFLNTIYNGALRLNNLINDIVELHRLESYGENTNEKPSNVTDLHKVLNEIKEYYYKKDRSIIYNCNVSCCNIKAEHLLSIFSNLIDNALKYTQGTIIVDINKREDFLVIAVSDEGPLIPSAERNRIFERFYTTSHSKNMQTKGTGLGLSIVKHIAKIYSGNAFVKSNRSGGNTFVVELKN